LLAEYSAGSLAWAISLGVAAHIDMCSECRSRVAGLNRIGAALLDTCPKHDVDDGAFEQLMGRIRQTQPQAARSESELPKSAINKDKMLINLPKVVNKLLPKDKPLDWKHVSPALKMARLKTGQNQYEVAFHKISLGGKVAEHDHKGLEITLVLKGSFSDGDGVYTPGDFLVRQQGEVHRPTAAQNEDCLCFSIVEAPVHLTGLLGKFINPFLSIRPA
jgi:putative transcriptional regulator